MNLKAELLRGVYAYGFERPSAIQQRAIMPVIKGEFPSVQDSRFHPLTWTQGTMSSPKLSPVPVKRLPSPSPFSFSSWLTFSSAIEKTAFFGIESSDEGERGVLRKQ